ncbi:simple sugar transport system permease protein [Allocatelliglobosispora scoriae]|uniref:Simple sugar transport system permease protein n=1 Tax=Allocatelliglobosispora scoriae TaxID=643052 RepID=A0A841BUJ7_9ACTN|nr:ABC transporter permease [Allocatelliglobosispora scoriae]MBB5870421.1 simple sugar transport system permease protein [Allocatelliglobosispora scoriae]
MTTTTVTGAVEVPVDYWTRARKTGAVLTAMGLIAILVFGTLASSSVVRFTFGVTGEGAGININGKVGAILFGFIALATGAILLLLGRHFGVLTGVSFAAFLISSLCWQISVAPTGIQFMPVGSVAQITLDLSIPLIFGALGGVLCERSGVVNVAIEGQFLAGAFMAAFFGSIAGSVWLGLAAAMIGGLIIALILAVFAIRYLVDQVVIGIVLNVFAAGLTGFLYEQFMRTDSTSYNLAPRVPEWEIPGLSSIPIIGPALFKGNVFTYGAFVLVAVLYFGLFKTRWGLRTRAVGEHPTAADTVGVRVLGLRYVNVLGAGLIAGVGGAYFTLLATNSFNKNMSSGLGFIALAAMIFGRWHPIGAFLAALFFGFFNALTAYLGGISSPIPGQFLAMLPYIATIIAVAGLVGRVRAPAADGKPYLKGH